MKTNKMFSSSAINRMPSLTLDDPAQINKEQYNADSVHTLVACDGPRYTPSTCYSLVKLFLYLHCPNILSLENKSHSLYPHDNMKGNTQMDLYEKLTSKNDSNCRADFFIKKCFFKKVFD